MVRVSFRPYVDSADGGGRIYGPETAAVLELLPLP